MLEKLQSLTKDNDELYDESYELRKELASLNQYGRRENVEFCNIPESINQENLQNHIITVMNSMDIKVAPKDIHNLHRIGRSSPSRPRNVIVRFTTNRKTAFTLLKNKKKLNSGNYKRYFITENLCPYNKRIFNALYRRKKNDELHSLWTYNGNVFVKIHELDDRTQVDDTTNFSKTQHVT